MIKKGLTIMCAGIAAFLSWGTSVVGGPLCCGASGQKSTQAVTEATPWHRIEQDSSDPVVVGNQICPVMGVKIEEQSKVTYEYEGKIYNFCCHGCVEAFKRNPQKYIDKVGEELKADDDLNEKEGQE